MAYTVAIVGRPNVGKSTLFNRLTGRKLALVDDTPGVTRDRREGWGEYGDLKFRVVDTAGFEEGDEASLFGRMRKQTLAAIAEADLCLFLIDARAGVTPLDKAFGDILRKSPKPVALLANKCEGRAGEGGLYEAYELGLGEPVPVSAEHGEGISDLYDIIVRHAPEQADEAAGDTDENRPLHLAIIGRPNVGKSTLLNRLLGRERVITGPEAGLTRDTIAVDWDYDGRPVRLFDTAGLRRQARITEKLEKLSAGDTLRAIQFADVVVVLVDAGQPFDRQDLLLASHVVDEGRGLILAVNKWDQVTDKKAVMAKLTDVLDLQLPQIKGVPVATFSARTGQGVDRLMPQVMQVHARWSQRIPTAPLNQWLRAALDRHPPPASEGRYLKLRYVTQVKSRPPTLALFANKPGELPKSYKQYLLNDLRQNFDLAGVPVRIMLRKGKNPYEDKE